MSDYKIVFHGADTDGVGHFFIEVQKDGVSNFYGFAPEVQGDPYGAGKVFDDQQRYYDDAINNNWDIVSKEMLLTEDEYSNLISYIDYVNNDSGTYVVWDRNCIDFCEGAYESIKGINSQDNFTNFFGLEVA